jgi:hypothetical protein
MTEHRTVARHYAKVRRQIEREMQPLFRNVPPGHAQDMAAIKEIATLIMLGVAAWVVTWFVAALIAGAAQ